MQLLFLRKEIENKIVRESNLLKDAVQVAVSNCLSKRKSKLWVKKKKKGDEIEISDSEIESIQDELKNNTPWTPWQKKGGGISG